MKSRLWTSSLALATVFSAGCSEDSGTQGPPAGAASGFEVPSAGGSSSMREEEPGGDSESQAPAGEETPVAPDGAPSSAEQVEVGGLDPSEGSDGAGEGAGEPSEPEPEGATEPPEVVASAGCGQSEGVPENLAIDGIILAFPPDYDGSTPFPLAFGFHGAGRTNEEMRSIDARTVGTALEENYVLAFMKSAGNAWNLGADLPRFNAALAQIHSQVCVEQERLFAFGHSSGAQFIQQLLGDERARETRFTGVVPVASSRGNDPAWSPVPTLVIHGLNDNQRGGDENGALDLVQYTQSNQCESTATPLDVPSCASFQGGAAVDPGCVQFEGCAAPTQFCNHDDPNYQNTNHGWPCFANQQIFNFFESLR